MRAKSYGAIRAAVKRSHSADVPASTRPDWRKEWETRKGAFVDSAFHRYMREPWHPQYAYFTKTDRVSWGALYAVPESDDPPAGAELITAERIPAADRASIARWLERFAGTLEVIPDKVY